MRIPNVVVFGYDELLIASLDFLSANSTNILAVVFPSNRKDERAKRVRELVDERGYRTLEHPPADQREEFVQSLSQLSPDLIFVWSYTMILSEDILAIPPKGCVNLHMGLLPEYRGVNGVRWALLNGEDKTGVTLHFMDRGIDSGDIIARVVFPITESDDILSLMEKSKIAGLHILKAFWPQIAAGKAKAFPQVESAAKYYASKSLPPSAIDWSRTSVQIHNLIRASVAPFPGVHTFCKNVQLTIKGSAILNSRAAIDPAGTIENISDGGIEVATGDGTLQLTVIEIDGEIISTAKLAEFGIGIGTRFTSGIAGQGC